MRSICLFVTFTALFIPRPIFSQVPDKVIGSYIGAYPCGIQTTCLWDYGANSDYRKDLCKDASGRILLVVPKEVNVLFVAFAKSDFFGNFRPGWDISSDKQLNKERITTDKNRNNRIHLMSIGGDGVPFGVDNSVEAWVDNAYTSITKLLNDYNFDGIDLNYESFKNSANRDLFAVVISQVISQLKKDKNYIVTVSPFKGTRAPYKALVETIRGEIDFINYQQYAEENTRTSRGIQRSLSETMTYFGNTPLTFGFCSECKPKSGNTRCERERGANIKTGLAVCSALKNSLKGTFTWASEFSSRTVDHCTDSNYFNNNFDYEKKAAAIFK